jgi:chromosome partitioning protein
MAVTAVANLKGGVGKTTIAAALAHAAASIGQRTLVVDADMQGNLSKQLAGVSNDNPAKASLADVLDRSRRPRVSAAGAIVASRRVGIDVLPSGCGELQAVADGLVNQTGAEFSLQRVIGTVRDDYAHVFIDCRPAIDLVSRGALIAADQIVVVVTPEPASIDGLDAIRTALADLDEYIGVTVPIAGIIINRVDARRDDHHKLIQHLHALSAAEGIPILGEIVPQRADISRLAAVGLGLDEHPNRPAWATSLHQNFIAVVKGL